MVFISFNRQETTEIEKEILNKIILSKMFRNLIKTTWFWVKSRQSGADYLIYNKNQRKTHKFHVLSNYNPKKNTKKRTKCALSMAQTCLYWGFYRLSKAQFVVVSEITAPSITRKLQLTYDGHATVVIQKYCKKNVARHMMVDSQLVSLG